MRYFTQPPLAVGAALAMMSPLALSGCPMGGELDRPGDFWGDDECDALPLFQQCSGGICHSGDDPSGTVELLAPGVEDRLIGVPASYANVRGGADACPTDAPELLVDPEDIERSLMLTKLTGTHACGDRMPFPPTPSFSKDEIDCVRKWIHRIVEAKASGNDTGPGGQGSEP